MFAWVASLPWLKILEIGGPIAAYIGSDVTVKYSPLPHNGLPQLVVGIAKGIGRGIVSDAPAIVQGAAALDPKHAASIEAFGNALAAFQAAQQPPTQLSQLTPAQLAAPATPSAMVQP